ncbi:MAG: hypothetical protein DM484_24380 [Candidatus Methylumidiphilus alinenensis]|uniref:Uncharacterized protein n=1 Tax=Candidatus Methylumidiphilus alinenensis TaxID=2202197 RepID=A0A2W4QMY0_9GAMM|nr:MAG: hypothetical protein DM484_24380 [Candidatus Methylumidiphilus alinenensis]
MNQLIKLTIAILFVLITGIGTAQSREILFTASPSAELTALAEKIKNLDTPKIPDAELTRNSVFFVRIAPRKNILTDNNQLQDNAILGTRPFIFVTTPEGVFGKSLLDIYLDIGYEAGDIIHWQRDQEMVAIIFRFEDGIAISDEKKGQLPNDWTKFVYIPTWDNMFALFNRLATNATVDPGKQGEFAPVSLFFKTDADKAFALNFPDAVKKHIKETSYANLQAEGGDAWVYRKLLENKLSLFGHFRGTGRTQNVIVDPDGTKTENGLLEFVGPNRKLKELPEVAIVELGKLMIEDSFSVKSTAFKCVPAAAGHAKATAHKRAH